VDEALDFAILPAGISRGRQQHCILIYPSVALLKVLATSIQVAARCSLASRLCFSAKIGEHVDASSRELARIKIAHDSGLLGHSGADIGLQTITNAYI
jgi:hypothetical protein